jgi:hypothetical protein
VRELEHRRVQRVEAGEGHELESVAEPRQVGLERRDRIVVQMPPPVEGRGAVVGEELPGVLGVHGLREAARLLVVGGRRLEPQDVRVRRVREPRAIAAFEPVATT